MTMQLIEYDPIPTTVAVRAEEYLAIARGFVIDGDDAYEAAVEELAVIKQIERDLDTERKARSEPLRAAVSVINDAYRAPMDFCAEAKVLIEDKIRAWREQQRRRAAEEEQRRQEAARAEQERLAREAAALEAAARAEQARLDEQARAAAAGGDIAAAQLLAQQAAAVVETTAAAAQALVEQAAMTVAAQTPAAAFIPKVKGLSGRVVWRGRVTDKAAALAAIAANPAYHHLVEFVEGEINHLVNRQREAFRIPGIETYQTEVLTNRRRA